MPLRSIYQSITTPYFGLVYSTIMNECIDSFQFGKSDLQ